MLFQALRMPADPGRHLLFLGVMSDQRETPGQHRLGPVFQGEVHDRADLIRQAVTVRWEDAAEGRPCRP